MTAVVLDALQVSKPYRNQIREEALKIGARGRRLRVAGLLAESHGPAATYARATRKLFDGLHIDMDLREVDRVDVSSSLAAANLDPLVDGIFLYYPILGGHDDRWLREVIDPRKDVEGLHSYWSNLLYQNNRYVDEHRKNRAIVPCTPLAIIKILQHIGVYREDRLPLHGVTACVINRSDVVGRPLAAMLANDGARVYSIDVAGAVLVSPPDTPGAPHTVLPSRISRRDALVEADVVVGGVPSASFDPVTATEIKPGAVCINVAERDNFDESVREQASVVVPQVGSLTTTMAARNLVRLASLLL